MFMRSKALHGVRNFPPFFQGQCIPKAVYKMDWICQDLGWFVFISLFFFDSIYIFHQKAPWSSFIFSLKYFFNSSKSFFLVRRLACSVFNVQTNYTVFLLIGPDPLCPVLWSPSSWASVFFLLLSTCIHRCPFLALFVIPYTSYRFVYSIFVYCYPFHMLSSSSLDI